MWVKISVVNSCWRVFFYQWHIYCGSTVAAFEYAIFVHVSDVTCLVVARYDICVDYSQGPHFTLSPAVRLATITWVAWSCVTDSNFCEGLALCLYHAVSREAMWVWGFDPTRLISGRFVGDVATVPLAWKHLWWSDIWKNFPERLSPREESHFVAGWRREGVKW